MYDLLSLAKLISGLPSSLVEVILFVKSETAQLNSGSLCVIASK